MQILLLDLSEVLPVAYGTGGTSNWATGLDANLSLP
jgi:hypothetical protein